MIAIILTLSAVALVSAGDPTVTISDGTLLGIEHTTFTNETYYGFHGIPYAKAPLGDLRFMSPQSPEPWTDTYNATYDRTGCVSSIYSENSDHESEDCLYLNVYTPTLKPAHKLPVLLWYHGGNFLWGNASYEFYGPHYIMEEQNVIFVSVEYRMGILGFISTNDSSIPGNAGLKDMLLALQWTHDNIANFGGDPDKITLFGESAGSAGIGMLLTNEKAQGLFRGVIGSSGSAFSSWTINHNATYMTYEVLSTLSRADLVTDTAAIKTFLQNLTVEELVATVPTSNVLLYPYPIVEPESDEAVLTSYQYELYQEGKFAKVPSILGMTDGEGVYVLQDLANAKVYAAGLESDNSTIVPADMFANESDYNAIITGIKSMYLEDGQTFEDNIPALVKYVTDFVVTKAMVKQAQFQSASATVYLFSFSYYGERLYLPAIEGPYKVSHLGDLPYVLYMSPFTSTNETDLLIQRRMTKMYTNFAHTLNPTPETTDLLNNLEWPRFSVDDQEFLNINVDLPVQSYLEQRALAAWDVLYDEYALKPLSTY